MIFEKISFRGMIKIEDIKNAKMNNRFLKLLITWLMITILICCRHVDKKQKLNYQKNKLTMIDKNRAIEISKKDATLVYGDLSVYEIQAHLEKDRWIVEYLLKDKNSVGGGPHYVISATDGKIISFKFYQ